MSADQAAGSVPLAARRRVIVFLPRCLPVAMRFFHPAGRGSAFPGRFRGQLFAGRFATRGLTSSLLGSGHFLSPVEQIPDSGAATLASRDAAAGVQGAGRPAPLPSRLLAPQGGRQMAEGCRLLPLP